MDEFVKTFEKRLIKLEEIQAESQLRLDEIENRVSQSSWDGDEIPEQVQGTTEKRWEDMEQQVEFEFREQIVDDIDKKFAELKSADDKIVEMIVENQQMEFEFRKQITDDVEKKFAEMKLADKKIFEMMLKNQLVTEQEVSELKKEIDILKECLMKKQKCDVALDTASEVVGTANASIYRKKLKNEIAELSTQVNQSILLRNDLVWKIPCVKDKITRNLKTYSKAFPLTGYPFWAQAVFKPEESNVSFLIRFAHPEQSGSGQSPSPRVVPRVHFRLRDASGSDELRDVFRSGSLSFGSTLKFDTNYSFRRFALSKALFLDPSYIADDAVTVEILVEPLHVTNRAHSNDGSLSWTIFNYRKCKELERKELMQYQLSPYFYTAPRGYRVQAVVYLNGDGENAGQGLSVGVSFQTGEFDRQLSSFFLHSTTITILDLDDPDKHVTKIVTEDIRDKNTSYTVDLWCHDLVEKFVIDDSLSLQLVIEAQ